MIKSRIVSSIKNRLGSRDDTDLDAMIDIELDLAQMQLEQDKTLPWFLWAEMNLHTKTNSQEISLPCDFITFGDEDGGVWYNDEKCDWRTRVDLETWFEGQTGSPSHVHVTAEKAYVYPIPDGVYRLVLRGFFADKAPSEVDTGSENLWMKFAPDALIAKTGAVVARYVKDAQAVAEFAADLVRAEARLLIITTMKAEEGRDRFMRGE